MSRGSRGTDLSSPDSIKGMSLKGTRLWKPAGSPLIQGRSRRERPFVFDWISGSVVGFLVGCAIVIAVSAARGTDVVTALQSTWPPAVPAAAGGSAMGVSLGRHFGWHPRWIAGATVGALTVVVATVAYAWFTVARLGG